ncbi:MAG: dual specificity protein phosphatase family protein [Desulfobacterales bacterium]
MAGYQLTWITDDLAVGYAPMSYDELDAIRTQGIDAIVNLCGEFCDLHEIEENSGFEVYYLPIEDECAPEMTSMETALDWLDEAIYLGKKVLVHCRHGIGRTGTFVTSYLLRRGLGLKAAEKKLKHSRAKPTNFCQWRLVKKFGKKSGVLTVRQPTLESRAAVDLSPFFDHYETLVQMVGENLAAAGEHPTCGAETDLCCRRYFEIQLIEAIYLTTQMNRTLKRAARTAAIAAAMQAYGHARVLRSSLAHLRSDPAAFRDAVRNACDQAGLVCPLNQDGRCAVFDRRPIRCRVFGVPHEIVAGSIIGNTLFNLSGSLYHEYTGQLLEDRRLTFSLAETVSGRYVEKYFRFLSQLGQASDGPPAPPGRNGAAT